MGEDLLIGYNPLKGGPNTAFVNCSFDAALIHLKQGGRVARKGWNGKGMWLALQVPDEHSKMRQPYIYIHPVGSEPVPWVASQPDLLCSDWESLA